MKATPKTKSESFPLYHGLEWDRKINDPNHPNFWKYGVANLMFLDSIRGRRLVLDLGCGTGSSTLFLAERGDAEWIVGVDLLRDMITVAKEKAVKSGLHRKICFLVCDGRHLPFKPSCFEALVSRGDAFCFLVPLKDAVCELKRVLRNKGVTVLEMDNRADWKPGTIISTTFQKVPSGGIAYVVEVFTAKRDHRSTSYILDPKGSVAEEVRKDPEFRESGRKSWDYPLQRIGDETVEVRQGVLTHWPTVKELRRLFERSGFVEIHLRGDGLLMKLLLEGDEAIVATMKAKPQLFFEIEKKLISHVDPEAAPTIILQAIVLKRADKKSLNY